MKNHFFKAWFRFFGNTKHHFNMHQHPIVKNVGMETNHQKIVSKSVVPPTPHLDQSMIPQSSHMILNQWFLNYLSIKYAIGQFFLSNMWR